MRVDQQLFAPAMRVTARAGAQARFAMAVLQAAGPRVTVTPPHRYLTVLRALERYGPGGAAVTLAGAAYGARIAIVDDRGPVTFADLDRRSSALASALAERGFHSGGGIGILARNHRGMFEAIFAATKLGARTVLLNTDFAGPQLADVCARESVSVLIHDDEFAGVAAGYPAPLGRVSCWPERAGGVPSIDSLIAQAGTRPPPRPRHRQRIVLLTSGTTGSPRGAPRKLPLTLALPGSYLSKIPLRAARTVLIAVPVFHAWGIGSAMISFALGDTLVMARRFDPLRSVVALERHRCDALMTVPILLARLLDLGAEVLGGHDLSALRIVALSGSPLSPQLAVRATELLGDVVYNVYGSTEVAYASIATPADLRLAPGTVGRPPAGTTVRVLDAEDRPVAPGATGRIFVGNVIQFEGYTGGGNKSTVDGLMATGDLGHRDARGLLFVDGREDEMIISGGENVFPGEVELLLTAQPEIAAAAVIGVPDPDFGQRLRAYVVRAPGADIDEGEVREIVRTNLARYKVPRDVVFVDELPRNAAGKVVKRLLPGA